MKHCYVLFALLVTNFCFSQTFDDALAKASKEDKNIILVFAGSDWCAPCIKLDKEVFQTEVFQKEKANWVMYKADFLKKSKLPVEVKNENSKLADTYNKEGYFPLVVLLDSKGKVLGKTGYMKATPMEYIKKLYSFIK
ncbi:MAG: thioredoxin family protein [Flavobacteriaceae bacterium]|jgi:thioredoxin-related protein|nr:thioredoxin family protein [Flavobacteriaceae bacterium]